MSWGLVWEFMGVLEKLENILGTLVPFAVGIIMIVLFIQSVREQGIVEIITSTAISFGFGVVLMAALAVIAFLVIGAAYNPRLN